MRKNKEVAKVPKRIAAKGQDSLSIELSKVEGSCTVQIIATEESFHNATGFRKGDSGMFVLSDLIDLRVKGNHDLEQKREKGNQILSAMGELRPQDGHEGMLISQMLSVHERAMYCLRMADNNKSFAAMYYDLQNQGIKLMRLFTQQLEALDKHRRKGNQTIIVEHVNVHDGGQAIVGTVNPQMKGGEE